MDADAFSEEVNCAVVQCREGVRAIDVTLIRSGAAQRAELALTLLDGRALAAEIEPLRGVCLLPLSTCCESENDGGVVDGASGGGGRAADGEAARAAAAGGANPPASLPRADSLHAALMQVDPSG
jgi:hypothetical protein